ncbi:MAG: CDP-glycerol glycerophosphotransferase family protein [Nitrospirota bacterium]
MRTIALGLCLLLTIFSGPAFAYLDPGTGSLLVSALVGLLATLLFFIKGLFYKIRRSILGFLGRTAEDDRVGQAIVFYSEGRHYWSTFRPVIDELVNRNVQCVYLTSDEEDPGLLYSSEFLSTKYIGIGTKAYAYLTILEADVCVMTTPGLDVLQIKRSKGVKHYAYLMHAPTDISTYKQYSFDYFDSLLISGDHQSKSLRKLEELRGTPRKLLLKTGCLYYDEMARQLKELDATPQSGNHMTVLVAPTWGRNGLLRKFGTRILIPLLEKQWEVILRPHPQSFISEEKMLNNLREEVKHYANLHWDNERDSTQSMARADVMVSDLSGAMFDFAFLFEKPVITMKYDLDWVGLEGSDLSQDPWEITVLDTIGQQISEKDLDSIPEIIEREIGKNDRKEMIRQLRDESVENFACAAKSVANELLHIQDEIQNKLVK